MGGRPLEAPLRALFEPRLGVSLGGVRIHTGPVAAQSSRAVDARAYTVGSDVVFGAGEYRPYTDSGRRLLAHELTHVAQQRQAASAPGAALRVGAPDAAEEREADATARGFSTHSIGSTPARMLQRANGPAANAPAQKPVCERARCTPDQRTVVPADLRRGIEYVDKSLAALKASPLAPSTLRALDWYFTDRTDATAREVARRLGCIRGCLQETLVNARWGCEPDETGAAFTDVPSTPVCSQFLTEICFTEEHFGVGPKRRAETVIHECGHRVGLALGVGLGSVPDVYDRESALRYLGTGTALETTEAFALFAGAVAAGLPASTLLNVAVGGGAAFPREGPSTWYAHLYVGTEVQHPVLRVFSPTLGVGLSLIGASTSPTTPTTTFPTTGLVSLLGGIRIGNPRPGAKGGFYASLFGGPAYAFTTGPSQKTGWGAEAGAALGYRWRWLDVSGGAGYEYDPTREGGSGKLLTLGATATFTPAAW